MFVIRCDSGKHAGQYVAKGNGGPMINHWTNVIAEGVTRLCANQKSAEQYLKNAPIVREKCAYDGDESDLVPTASLEWSILELTETLRNTIPVGAGTADPVYIEACRKFRMQCADLANFREDLFRIKRTK